MEQDRLYLWADIRPDYFQQPLSVLLSISNILSATSLSGLLFTYKSYLRILGGCLIIVFGLHLTGIVQIRFLHTEKRFQLKQKPLHFLGAFIIGMAFGAGWSPCIGPMLGSILILAGNEDTVAKGVLLLALYSAGLAVPFMVLSLGTNYLVQFVRRTTRIMRAVNVVAGTLLIATGILLITDKFGFLTSLF